MKASATLKMAEIGSSASDPSAALRAGGGRCTKNREGTIYRAPTGEGARGARRSFSGGGLPVTSRRYCGAIALGLAKTEPIRIPAICGNPPKWAGMLSPIYRCPDADD